MIPFCNGGKSMNDTHTPAMTHPSIQRLLTYFFTGAGISLFNKMTYPYVSFPKKTIVKELELLENIQGIKISERTEKLQKEITKMKEKNMILPNDLAKFLAKYFSTLNEDKKIDVSMGKAVKITINEINIELYQREDKEYIHTLMQLKEYGKEIKEKNLGSLFLFGSFATKDYIKGHSDLDTAILINKETCCDADKLLELRKIATKIMKESYFIDSLQHHGPYILTNFDCDAYMQTFLPFAVWENAVSFSEDAHITFNEKDAEEEAQKLLENYRRTFLEVVEKEKKYLPRTNYSQKFLYQVFLLFPSVYLLAQGKPCYKRESFAMIEEELSKEANELIYLFSKIRETNAFKTKPASIPLQKFFRIIPLPFLYPFLYRILSPSNLSEKIRKEVEDKIHCGAKDMIDVIDSLNKKRSEEKQ
jgi:predicted nucleotidyltransferase/septum formation topological specificity factor MinE